MSWLEQPTLIVAKSVAAMKVEMRFMGFSLAVSCHSPIALLTRLVHHCKAFEVHVLKRNSFLNIPCVRLRFLCPNDIVMISRRCCYEQVRDFVGHCNGDSSPGMLRTQQLQAPRTEADVARKDP